MTTGMYKPEVSSFTSKQCRENDFTDCHFFFKCSFKIFFKGGLDSLEKEVIMWKLSCTIFSQFTPFEF